MPDVALYRMADAKPLVFVGSSREDLRAFPKAAKARMGHALNHAQTGGKHPDARPLKGFGGASVLEIVEDYNRNTYRVVYTVRFASAVYVLHAFQKKSKRGVATPKHDMNLIRARLKEAETLHAARVRKEGRHE
jgi:phage-related protein